MEKIKKDALLKFLIVKVKDKAILQELLSQDASGDSAIQQTGIPAKIW